MAEGSTESEETSPVHEVGVVPEIPEPREALVEPAEPAAFDDPDPDPDPDPDLEAGLLEKTVQQSGFRNEVDRYIDGKREQTLQAARDEADGFLEDWLVRIERRIDHKLVEIEDKIDEQIEKELRAKVWILILTLVTVVGMSVVSLAYFWFKDSVGFQW